MTPAARLSIRLIRAAIELDDAVNALVDENSLAGPAAMLLDAPHLHVQIALRSLEQLIYELDTYGRGFGILGQSLQPITGVGA
jgi:hypothetical protein